MRTNRTDGATKNLRRDKELKTEGRGSIDYRCDRQVYIAKWVVSSIVHVASNNLTHEPLKSAWRRSASTLSSLSSSKSTTKAWEEWIYSIVCYPRTGPRSFPKMVVASVFERPELVSHSCMAPLLSPPPYCKGSHLDFRRTITLCLLKISVPRARIGGGQHPQVPGDIRFDGIGHYSVTADQGHCAICSSNTRSKCETCDVRHLFAHQKPCFNIYHNN